MGPATLQRSTAMADKKDKPQKPGGKTGKK